MKTSPVDAVEREVRIRANPETIFPFLIEPGQMARWMGIAVEADPRPGGVYRVDVDGGGHVARGEFVEVSPPERVVFTWGWEADDSIVRPGTSTVEVTLTPEGDHTIVRLVHSGLPSTESAAAHTTGWDHYLPRLEIVAGGGDAGPDPWAERHRDAS